MRHIILLYTFLSAALAAAQDEKQTQTLDARTGGRLRRQRQLRQLGQADSQTPGDLWENLLDLRSVGLEASSMSFMTSSPSSNNRPSPPTTRRPTPKPTPAPQTKPSTSPIQAPVSIPTRQPSFAPLSPTPTNRPITFPPTIRPTGAPIPVPTQSPASSPCEIDLTTRCSRCENLPVIDPTCQGPPTKLRMRFVGGSCRDSSDLQDITCFDFGEIPTTTGERAYILVQFRETVYFSGWVNVGEDYTIQRPNGGTLGQMQSIVLYKSDNLLPGNVLQSLVFTGDCSEPLSLKDQYGASEVVGFVVNGEPTNAYASLTLTHDIGVPSMSAVPVTVETLVTESNYQNFNFTESVSGRLVSVGRSITVNFEITIDVTVPKGYNFVSSVTGSASGGATCADVSFLSFRPPAPAGPT